MTNANGRTRRPPREPGDETEREEPRTKQRRKFAPITAAQLIYENPHMAEPLIDGLFRVGEVVNVIAAPKTGKSWMVLLLALSVATGTDWLGFPCRRRRVLIIDNELHPAVLANRIKTVADAMGLRTEDYADWLHIVSLRGHLMGVGDIKAKIVAHIARGQYELVILDALYKATTTDENSNTDRTSLYNSIDELAALTGAAWVLIHHSSKGDQSSKVVTDIGAGAGSQSRAADCHLALREHEEEGCIVLDGVTRSFPPVDPRVLRFCFPLWQPQEHLDPAALKMPKGKGDAKQERRDSEGMKSIVKTLGKSNMTRRKLREKTGMGPDRLNRLVTLLIEDGQLTETTEGETEILGVVRE